MASVRNVWCSVLLWLRHNRVRLSLVGMAVLAVVATSISPTYASERVFINAKAAIVMDADTHKVLYAKNPDVPLYPASTTKLMTAVLLVTHLNPDDKVFISPEAARQPRVRLGLKSGTTITAEQALHAIIMKSANDVAYAVAQTVGGSQQGFARMMNLKAGLIGCRRTNFVTPNGLHDDAHKTTARDVALITAEAIKYPRIVAVMQTKEYQIAGIPFRNGNRMLYLDNPSYGTLIGGKTGFTSKAMFCLALAAKQHGHTRISVVLGAPRKSFMYRETRRLLEFANKEKPVQIV